MHGFYVEEEKHLITFDLIVDFKTKVEPEAIKDVILKEISTAYPNYQFVAILDDDYNL